MIVFILDTYRDDVIRFAMFLVQQSRSLKRLFIINNPVRMVKRISLSYDRIFNAQSSLDSRYARNGRKRDRAERFLNGQYLLMSSCLINKGVLLSPKFFSESPRQQTERQGRRHDGGRFGTGTTRLSSQIQRTAD